MTELEKQMAEALRFQLLSAANYVDVLGGDSKSYRQAIAQYDAPAAEQAAGGGEAVAWVDEQAIAWLASHPRGTITTPLAAQSSPERPMPIYTHPAPAAPSDPQPRGAEPQVWLYDFMDGATTVRNWSTTNKAEAFAPGNFNQRGYVPAEN